MALSTPAMEKDLSSLKAEIRACLIATASKNMVTLQELNNAYRAMNGKFIPHNQFHFRSLEEFLFSLNDTVNLVKNGPTYYCGPVTTAATAHIQKLVGGQKSTGKKRGLGRKELPRPILKTAWVNSPVRPVVRHVQRPLPLMQSQFAPPRQRKSPEMPTSRTPYSVPQPLTLEELRISYSSNGTHRSVQFATPNTTRFRAPHFQARRMPPPFRQPLMQPSFPVRLASPPRVISPPKPVSLKDRVKQLASSKGLPEPTEKCTLAGKMRNEVVAKVRIGEDRDYSSYPAVCKREQDALDVAYKKALDDLMKLPDVEPASPLSSSNEEITMRILQMLDGHSGGLWASSIETSYQSLFSEKLPPNWVYNLDTNILVSEAIGQDWIINVKKERTPTPSGIPFSPVGLSSPEVNEKGDLGYSNGTNGKHLSLLPVQLSESDEWEVYVTVVRNSSVVSFRIETGEEDAYDELSNNMELFYINDSNVLDSVNIGEPYAVYMDSLWFRAIISQQNEDGTYTVELVDTGDIDVVPLERIRKLNKEFFEVPLLGISAEVAGFQGVTESHAAYDLLVNKVLAKTVIAKVLNRDPLTVQLFAVADEDGAEGKLIDINQLMIDAVVEKESDISLPPVNSMGKCYVPYIYPNGDIYVNLNSTSFHLVSNLIELLVAKHEDLIVPSVSSLFEDPNRIFLAMFTNDGLYYRAVVKTNQTSSGTIAVQFIDFGNVEIVALNDFREIPASETALLTLPPQAKLVRLNGVPDPAKSDLEFSPLAKDYLRRRIPDDKQIFIQVITPGSTSGGVPLVEFLETTEQHECVSINATMKLREDLFCRKSGRSTPVGSAGDRRSSSGSLRSTTPPTSVSLPPRIAMDMGEYVDVHILLSANPARFYVQRLADRAKYESMVNAMHEVYQRKTSVGVKPIAGSYMVAFHDGSYHRVKIRNLEAMPKFALVDFIDVGNEGVVSYDDLFPLEEQFAQLPPQGIKCSLAGVEGFDWSFSDVMTFKEMVEGKDFSSKLCKVDGDINEIYLVDVSDPELDVFVHEEMAKRKSK